MYQIPTKENQKKPIYSTVSDSNAYTQNLSQKLTPDISHIDPEYFEFDKDQEFRKKIELDIKFRAAEENMLAEVAGIEWFLTDPNDQENPTIPFYTALLRKMNGFLGSRVNLAQSVLWGLSLSKMCGRFEWAKLPGDTKTRRWYFVDRMTDINRDRIRRSVHTGPGNSKIYRWNIYNVFKRQWEVLENERDYVWSEYRPEEGRIGYGNGLGKSLYYSYKLMATLFEMLAMGAQRFAGSWIIAKIENLRSSDNMYGDTDTIDDIIDEIEKMRAHGVLVIDKDNDISGFSDTSDTGYRIITESIQEIKKDILILLTGVNLTTQIDGGGSFAATQAQAEQQNKRMTIQREMSIAEPLTDYLMPVLYKNNLHNFQAMGLGDFAIPRYNVSGGTVFNATERLPVFEFASRAGYKVADQDIREQLQLTPVSKTTDTAEIEDIEATEPETDQQGEMKYSQKPAIDTELKKQDRSVKIPKKLINLMDEIGVDIFRRHQGEPVDIHQSQSKAEDLIRKIMLYYDIQGQAAAGEEITKQLKEDGLDPQLFGDPIREI